MTKVQPCYTYMYLLAQ